MRLLPDSQVPKILQSQAHPQRRNRSTQNQPPTTQNTQYLPALRITLFYQNTQYLPALRITRLLEEKESSPCAAETGIHDVVEN